MYYITEKKNTDGIFYELKVFSGNNTLSGSRDIQVSSYLATTDSGEKIIMLYDSFMKPIEEAIQFLNYGGMKGQSQNYVLQAVTALKLLYCYLELHELDFETMNTGDATEFLAFLKGVSQEGLLYTTDLKTKRGNETIASYLNAVRRYAEYLGYDNHVFLVKDKNIKTLIMPESGGAKNVHTYKLSVKVPQKTTYVPQYIKVEEFKSILGICAKTSTPLRDRVICRLMFEHGLRIGEVLGLTLEDIKYREKKDFSIQYRIELRNRVSDSSEQCVKSVMNASSPDVYSDPDYRKRNVGYQVIILGEDLATELLEYINTAHSSDDKKYMKRHDIDARADSVPFGNPSIKKNFYVFLNIWGRPLSENTWNKHLRSIFKDAGLVVDSNVRKNNLNHRLRHGYAMFLSKVVGLNDFDIKTLMRHKNLATTAIYHNPTPEDVDKMQEVLVDKWNISLLKGSEENNGTETAD